LEIRLELAVFMCIVVFRLVPAQTQRKVQYMPGQQGVNAGVLPDSGIICANS